MMIDTAVDSTSAPHAITRTYAGGSGLRAQGISACARMPIPPKQVSTASESGRSPRVCPIRGVFAGQTHLTFPILRLLFEDFLQESNIQGRFVTFGSHAPLAWVPLQ